MSKAADDRRNLEMLNKIIRAIRAGAVTAPELMERFQANDSVVRRQILKLHDVGAVHVAEYRKTGVKHYTAAWAWGEGQDAEKPDLSQVSQLSQRGPAPPPGLPEPMALGAWGLSW